jgi:hypothetical protein
MRKLPRHLQGEVLMPLSSRITRSQRLELIWLLPFCISIRAIVGH